MWKNRKKTERAIMIGCRIAVDCREAAVFVSTWLDSCREAAVFVSIWLDS